MAFLAGHLFSKHPRVFMMGFYRTLVLLKKGDKFLCSRLIHWMTLAFRGRFVWDQSVEIVGGGWIAIKSNKSFFFPFTFPEEQRATFFLTQFWSTILLRLRLAVLYFYSDKNCFFVPQNRWFLNDISFCQTNFRHDFCRLASFPFFRHYACRAK